MSSTLTRIRAVPVLCGRPPSAAVRTSINCACSSRSNCFSNSSSAYLLPSPRECTSRLKYSLELIA
uniref:Uncharacterized protein n=1 Tax=Gopherus evgoodei TaxID=1825980 RepID=A0A8C4YG56_9SAUR